MALSLRRWVRDGSWVRLPPCLRRSEFEMAAGLETGAGLDCLHASEFDAGSEFASGRWVRDGSWVRLPPWL